MNGRKELWQIMRARFGRKIPRTEESRKIAFEYWAKHYDEPGRKVTGLLYPDGFDPLGFPCPIYSDKEDHPPRPASLASASAL
jgi:hypothetical protein